MVPWKRISCNLACFKSHYNSPLPPLLPPQPCVIQNGRGWLALNGKRLLLSEISAQIWPTALLLPDSLRKYEWRNFLDESLAFLTNIEHISAHFTRLIKLGNLDERESGKFSFRRMIVFAVGIFGQRRYFSALFSFSAVEMIQHLKISLLYLYLYFSLFFIVFVFNSSTRIIADFFGMIES